MFATLRISFSETHRRYASYPLLFLFSNVTYQVLAITPYTYATRSSIASRNCYTWLKHFIAFRLFWICIDECLYWKIARVKNCRLDRGILFVLLIPCSLLLMRGSLTSLLASFAVHYWWPILSSKTSTCMLNKGKIINSKIPPTVNNSLSFIFMKNGEEFF